VRANIEIDDKLMADVLQATGLTINLAFKYPMRRTELLDVKSSA